MRRLAVLLAVSCGATPAPPQQQCDPQGGGPYWLLEGETASIPLSCATGLALDGDAFVPGPLPAGAVYDPVAAVITWTPALDQGAVYELAIEVPELGERGSVKVGVADRWYDPANTPVVDPGAYTEEYGLPVFHLFTDPALNADDYTPAGITYRGHVYAGAEAKLRGAASLWYPKNSYTLKFTREDKFGDPAATGGFTGKRKVVLTTTFDDNSYLRQRLAFELWNRLDPGHLQVQTYSAVLFRDGEYVGLYTVTDHVDGFFMEDRGYRQDANLYKAVDHDANFRLVTWEGADKETLHDGYEKKEGLPVDDFADLEALVQLVDTAGDAELRAQLDQVVDRRDFEDWWIFVSLIEADDSAGKNAYLWHDPLAGAAGRWRYAPWDFNHSFGQTWQSERQSWDAHPEDYAWANELFVRLLGDPTWGAPLRARYGQVLHGVWDAGAVLALVDEMVVEIDASARRDEAKWGAAYRTYDGWSWRDDFLSYQDEVAYLRAWIADRWGFVDAVY